MAGSGSIVATSVRRKSTPMHRLVLAAAAFSLLASGAAAQELLADSNKDGKITPQEWDRAAAKKIK